MTPQLLISLVASAFGLTSDDLIGPSRTRLVAKARQAAAWVLRRTYTAISLEEIGHLLGHRDHTTIGYSVRQIEQRMAADPLLRGQRRPLRQQAVQLGAEQGIGGHAMRWWVAQARDSFFARTA